MSKIRVTSKCALYDGMSITFKAPCDCSAVDGLNVYYNGEKHPFSLRDTHGNDLAGVANLYTAGAYIKAILNTAEEIAYLQNADSNAYLEARLDNVLKDETKGLYGLGADAVPDQAFAHIGKYNQHWWKRTALVPVLVGNEVTVKSKYSGKDYFSISHSSGTVYAAEEYEIDQETGAISLVNPVEVAVSSGWKEDSMLGKWIMPGSNASFVAAESTLGKNAVEVTGPVKWPSSTDGYSSGGGYLSFSSSKVYVLDAITELQSGAVDYVRSIDGTAYPHTGNDGSFEYEYLGIPFENAVAAPKLATGSYVGTGTYGASNPNTLSFAFVPKLVIVGLPGTGGYTPIIMIQGQTSTGMNSSSNSYAEIIVSWSEKSVTWYSSKAVGNQGNVADKEYFYIAIG